MKLSYPDFFRAATGKTPYLWQCRLACGEPPEGANCDLENPDEATAKWLSGTHPDGCQSRLIDIPTGLGKTAGVVLAWLWSVLRSQSVTLNQGAPKNLLTCPRRLVYCLPMRTLVEQTEGDVIKWIFRLALAATEDRSDARNCLGQVLSRQEPSTQTSVKENGWNHEGSLADDFPSDALNTFLWLVGVEATNSSFTPYNSSHSPIVLMGGEELDPAKKDWDIHPERPAILIGTQDMLLSRALNRGYGMSRYRWPMHFALLNNDCLWAMDEVQLMGNGLWTSSQLDWMRECRFKPQFPVKTWWMSATLGGDFLATSDRCHEKMPRPDPFRLGANEAQSLSVLKACRPVYELKLKPPPKKSATKKAKSAPKPQSVFDQIAVDVAANHVSGTLSLIVCNRIAIAQDIYHALSGQTHIKGVPVKLLSSRFRPKDREETLKAVTNFESARKAGDSTPGLILVSTQVVEAGFDVSATRLWTQLAPWPSIVQRLGRLNRDGQNNDLAQAYVFELPEDKKDPNASLPYEKEDLKTAKAIVDGLVKLSQAARETPSREILDQLKNGPLKEKVRKTLEPKPQPYPRALDVHGLFSTEPDVFGGFTDVSHWVRNADASADVTVFWRDFEDKGNAVNQGEGPGFQREEGCPVAVYHLKNFLKTSKSAYHWNPKTDQWERIRPDDIRPGMTLLLAAKAGGYDIRQGWTGPKGGNLGPVPPPGPFEQRDEDDRETETGDWVPLEEHLANAETEAVSIAEGLALTEESPLRQSVVRGAALHDIGKSLEKWQEALLETHEAATTDRAKILWAKSPRGTSPFRPGLRHEVASALAMWHRYYREGMKDEFPTLAIYLVAAHHGKARTVLAARQRMDAPNVCGIPIPPETPPISPLPWPPGWQMDFSPAADGASGEFSEDGTEFFFEFPGWTGLVADLLGGWEKDAPARTCGAVPKSEPAALGPFKLAYYETLLRAADGRASADPKNS